MKPTVILGIETSCDETSAAVLETPYQLRGHIVSSQDEHSLYGGVVPEIAARAHLRLIDEVVKKALEDASCELEEIDAVAVTAGPGLIGALLVGVSWAKAFAFGLGKPLVPVHHMEGHLFAPSLENHDAQPPFVALLVSGGHTLLLYVQKWGEYELLGQTRDDAAGEAFDKVSKLLGLGYPGGPVIEQQSERGCDTRYRFPRPMLRKGATARDSEYYDFSFSGLKTAVSRKVEELKSMGMLEESRADIAASFQATAVDVLCKKTMRAVKEKGCPRVLLGGGVSANSRLKKELADELLPDGVLYYGSPRLSADNAAMIACAGAFRLQQGEIARLDLSGDPNLSLPGLRDYRL
jgi:N6-L-threonylcarbamoyladenine synthase